MNNNQGILYGIIGLLAGVVLTGAIMSFSGNSSWSRSGGMMGDSSDHMSMSMNDMADELREKSGDDFDKAFLEMMIDHHQGAVDMARETLKSAKHQELKTMANDIITAQEKEISQMKAWQKEWGY
jgi:uncharacterized protein (DUF305 family)